MNAVTKWLHVNVKLKLTIAWQISTHSKPKSYYTYFSSHQESPETYKSALSNPLMGSCDLNGGTSDKLMCPLSSISPRPKFCKHQRREGTLRGACQPARTKAQYNGLKLSPLTEFITKCGNCLAINFRVTAIHYLMCMCVCVCACFSLSHNSVVWFVDCRHLLAFVRWWWRWRALAFAMENNNKITHTHNKEMQIMFVILLSNRGTFIIQNSI